MAQDIKPEDLGLDLELKDQLDQVKPEDIEVVHTQGEPIPAVDRPERKPGEPRPDFRIRQKHWEKSEADRLAEAARRERDGALQAAETFRQRAQQLEQTNLQLRQLATAAVGANLDAEITKAEQDYTAALKGNSPEKVTELNSKLAELKAKKVAFQNGAAQYQQPPAPAQPEANGAGVPAPPSAPLYPEAPGYAQQREAWRQQNADWFGVSSAGQPLNEASRKILQVEQNVVRSGVVRGSSAYWRVIHGAVAQIRGTGASTAVMGSSRSAAGNGAQKSPAGRKQVELSEDERRAAARLGVPEKDYALEKWRILQLTSRE
jgi:hypothetical protein